MKRFEAIPINAIGTIDEGKYGLKPMTFEEIEADRIQASIDAKNTVINAIISDIKKLEAKITTRRLREAVMTSDGKAWLEKIDVEIAAKRLELDKAMGQP